MSAWSIPWPHQVKGINGVLAAIKAGHRRILLSSPTGAGKTRIAGELIGQYVGTGEKASLYLHRKLLLEQASRVFAGMNLPHGIRAAGYKDDRELPFQISSVQTETARVMNRVPLMAETLHDADLIVIEEAHLMGGESVQAIVRRHLDKPKAVVVGITATPIGLADCYDVLVQAGVNSELRTCGALVAAHHFGPDEPDMKGIKASLGEDLTEGENRKAIMRTGIFGRVLDNYRKLNPDQRPTILFAPGVQESIWFAEQFEEAGIPAAHIDGDSVWIRGKLENSSRAAREEVFEAIRTGAIKVVTNRFVLREGLDLPCLSHGIFATVIGSLQSYLQMGGRLLRAAPGKQSATIQDHGGSWHRMGSLNADRYWTLDDTAARLTGTREEGMREGKIKEPVRCPQCSQIIAGRWCTCGFDLQSVRKTRPVVQTDGTLRYYDGDVYKPRQRDERPEAVKEWESMFFRAKKAKMTFRQAEALYAIENNWKYPPRDIPLMPRNEADFFRQVADVPYSDLISKENQ